MLSKQTCMQCQNNQAAVKLTKLVKGTVEELWLCHECAARHSPYQKKMGTMSLDALLAGILSQSKEEAAARPGSPATDLSCPSCGMPYDSYRSTLLLGCSECYEAFEKMLVPDLRKFHGATVHRGRVPESTPETFEAQRDPSELKRRLQEAVDSENFELAAKLRDELKRVTGAGTTNA